MATYRGFPAELGNILRMYLQKKKICGAHGKMPLKVINLKHLMYFDS